MGRALKFMDFVFKVDYPLLCFPQLTLVAGDGELEVTYDLIQPI